MPQIKMTIGSVALEAEFGRTLVFRTASSAPRRMFPKGKQDSRQEEDGNNERQVIRGHLR